MGRKSALTAEQRQAVRYLFSTGDFTKKELASKFGVSQNCIANVIQYERLTPEELEEQKCISFVKQETKARLIESMSDFALESNWDDKVLIKKLFECGLTVSDFVSCGYGAFVKDNFEIG